MDYHKIAHTAMLAGSIMLEHNAETYRVEDTIEHILRISQLEHAQAFVLPTGIMLSLSGNSVAPISLIHRTKSRATDLTKIHQVNHISRALVNGDLTIDQAYEQLQRLSSGDYPKSWAFLAVILLSISFTIMFGGQLEDIGITLLNSIYMALLFWISAKYHIHLFFTNLLGAIGITLFSAYLTTLFPNTLTLNFIMVGSIMPMVPGTIITNAIRDTFHGDFTSGLARSVEALFIACTIAFGVAVGFVLAGGGVLLT